jgi:hypothetical protein
MNKFNFGRYILPVSLFCSPEESYRARVAKQENVDALEKSLLQFGSLNEHVEVVMFVSANKPLPAKANFKPPQTAEELKLRGAEGYFTIVGDHTQRAMNQLRQKFSKNPKWASIEVKVFVCPRTTEVYAALKSWGILDNIKGEKRVTVSFHDKVTALHEDYLALKEHEGSAGHKDRTSSIKEQRRMDFGAISSGQMMQLWSIAAREGPVWDLLLKIIVGDIVAPQALKANTSRKSAKRGVVKAVNSAANFVNIGGIDDDILVSLLNEVVVGHASLQRLNEKCALVKARMKVQTAILQDQAIDADDWEVAKASFPVACDEHFVERWACSLVREGVKARAALPDLFFVEVDRRISADKSSAASRGQAAVSVRPLILMRCEIHFQNVCMFFLRLCPTGAGRR